MLAVGPFCYVLLGFAVLPPIMVYVLLSLVPVCLLYNPLYSPPRPLALSKNGIGILKWRSILEKCSGVRCHAGVVHPSHDGIGNPSI